MQWASMPHLTRNCCQKRSCSRVVLQTLDWTASWIESLRGCSVAGFVVGSGSTAMMATGAGVPMGASYLNWTGWKERACSANCWSWMTEKEASACWR
jgi:hypothetical protein